MTEWIRGTSLPVGARMVSTSAPPSRRKKARWEMTDEEKYAEMKREMSFDDWEKHGELDPEIVNANEPPPDWGQ